jgi:hypothetical protein
MRERVRRIRQLAAQPPAKAVAAGAAVFAVLYLAVGIGVLGFNMAALSWAWWGWTLGRPVVLTLAAFAGVALYAGRLKRDASRDAVAEIIERREVWTAVDMAQAVAVGVGVFAVLYLAEGMRLFAGHGWWYVLVWVWVTWGISWRLVFNVGAFAAVAVYAARLKLETLQEFDTGPAVARMEVEIARWQEQAESARRDAQLCREELRGARKAAKDAEIRAVAAEFSEQMGRAMEEAARGKGGASSGGRDEKFTATKNAFARMFHPDNVKSSDLEKVIRAEIFKEFWREIEIIEGKRRK